jgi:hypothetical protein
VLGPNSDSSNFKPALGSVLLRLRSQQKLLCLYSGMVSEKPIMELVRVRGDDMQIAIRPNSFGLSILLTACLLLFTPEVSGAIEPGTSLAQYAHQVWRFGDAGLLGSPLRITQTAEGYIWASTSNGLFRFDGIHHKVDSSRRRIAARQLHRRDTCCAQWLPFTWEEKKWDSYIAPGIDDTSWRTEKSLPSAVDHREDARQIK